MAAVTLPSAPGQGASRKAGARAANLRTLSRVLTNTPEYRGISFAALLAVVRRGLVRENTSSYVYPVGMTDAPHSGHERANTSAGHLSVSIDGAHVEDFRFS